MEYTKIKDKNSIQNDRYIDKVNLVKLLLKKLDYKGKLIFNHQTAEAFIYALDCTKNIKTNKYKNEVLSFIGNNIINLSITKNYFIPSYSEEYSSIDNNKANERKDILNDVEKYNNKEYLKSIVEELELYKYTFDDNYIYNEDTKDLIDIPEYDYLFKSIIGALYYSTLQLPDEFNNHNISKFVCRILKLKYK